MIKVSIIVAVYNAEKYLEECLYSLVNQTYNNCEIILIDDGSKDSSPKICDSYANAYDNIFIYHKKNGGVSSARNFGVSKATGDYITFVDSDDYISLDTITLLVNNIKKFNSDLVSYGYNYIYQSKNITCPIICNNLLSASETKQNIFIDDSIRGFCCNKLYKREIIIRNKIKFDSEISLCEDLLFNFIYCQYITTSSVINQNLYNYRMRKSSASNYNNEKNLTIFTAIFQMWRIDNNLYDYIEDFYSYIYFKYYKQLKKLNRFDNIKKLSIFKTLLNNNISIKTRLYCFIYRYTPDYMKKVLKRVKQSNNKYFE